MKKYLVLLVLVFTGIIISYLLSSGNNLRKPYIPPIELTAIIEPTSRTFIGPKTLATALVTLPEAVPSSTPTAANGFQMPPTALPDYVPGNSMAALVGESPFTISLLPGGWQAYRIGPSASSPGYLVDVTPLRPAVDGVHMENKILPVYLGGQWIDVLWLRSPEIQEPLPIQVDLISTKGWTMPFQIDAVLKGGDWAGFAMFANQEGSGGVLDITPGGSGFQSGTYIENTRVQPEFPGEWLQVARVQVSQGSGEVPVHLTYYTPGSLGREVFRQAMTLQPGVWSGFGIAPSSSRQGYVVEVIPLETADNEVSLSLVQAEFDGVTWTDVLRIMVPAGRLPLDALVRVLVVPGS